MKSYHDTIPPDHEKTLRAASLGSDLPRPPGDHEAPGANPRGGDSNRACRAFVHSLLQTITISFVVITLLVVLIIAKIAGLF